MATTIAAHNHPGKLATVNDEDADLARFTWTHYRGRFQNGYNGYLHRVIMGRICDGAEIHPFQLVLPIDGNFLNCRRENLELISREDWLAKRRRKAKRFAHQIQYSQATGYWRVLPDKSEHSTEEAAVQHLAQLLHKD